MEQATPGAFGGNAFDFGVKFSFKSCNIFFFFSKSVFCKSHPPHFRVTRPRLSNTVHTDSKLTKRELC